MTGSKFVYVTYIRTTPEKLFAALTQPEFTKQFWAGTYQVSDWKVGADWKIMIPDGRVGDSGKILEYNPPKRLKLSWRNEFMPELKAEGHTTCTYELEPAGTAVKLTLTHEINVPNSKTIAAISNGWPHLLASLKSLLETGEPLIESAKWPDGH
ncbi:MAG TPA: SRPBCC family protein [Hyphomonadaceae bacterium]|jgi:uncharacterized protein YndB with AHSA1/START domain|nr:SRPBCC family protein [Hyphomonadaceae bacterium]